MDELKLKVKKILTESNESMTIPQICLNVDEMDEYKVLHVIAELEYSKEVAHTGFLKFYSPDGSVGYLAEYGCVG